MQFEGGASPTVASRSSYLLRGGARVGARDERRDGSESGNLPGLCPLGGVRPRSLFPSLGYHSAPGVRVHVGEQASADEKAGTGESRKPRQTSKQARS